MRALRAAAIGAAAMYLLDPDRGRRRRALARDKTVSLVRRGGDFVTAAGSDAGHRLRALGATARRLRDGDDTVSDEVLVERVRARLGRVVSHPHAVQVGADQGRVRLTGPILSREYLPLMVAVRLVRGVRAVDDQALVRHTSAGDVPALQGGDARRVGLLDRHWPPALRLAAIGGGGTIALAGLRCSGVTRVAMSAIGLALVARGALNKPLRDLIPGVAEATDGSRRDALEEDTTDDWTRGADMADATQGRTTPGAGATGGSAGVSGSTRPTGPVETRAAGGNTGRTDAGRSASGASAGIGAPAGAGDHVRGGSGANAGADAGRGASAPRPGDAASPLDRQLNADTTVGGPQVYSLPNAPTDWEHVTGASRSSVTLSEDPGRPLDELGGMDNIGTAADRESLDNRDTAAPPSGWSGGSIASQTAPLEQPGAPDAKGHRYSDRDPGLSRSLPGDRGDGSGGAGGGRR